MRPSGVFQQLVLRLQIQSKHHNSQVSDYFFISANHFLEIKWTELHTC